jgi:hypothetical protein
MINNNNNNHNDSKGEWIFNFASLARVLMPWLLLQADLTINMFAPLQLKTWDDK